MECEMYFMGPLWYVGQPASCLVGWLLSVELEMELEPLHAKQVLCTELQPSPFQMLPLISLRLLSSSLGILPP